MKILKYQKSKNNTYKIITDKGEYKLYDDIIIKYELLLKKEISDKELKSILNENNKLAAYYEGLKALNIKLRCVSELKELLTKKYSNIEIDYAINKLKEEGYLNPKTYIEAYIHDSLTLNLVGETKILNDLLKLGFSELDIKVYLDNIDKSIYKEKIEKYIAKKAKVNKKSIKEFKSKILIDLVNKGFDKSDILIYLEELNIEENKEEIEKLINKLYTKYIKKYDLYTTKLKIKNSLYTKGYTDINIEDYIESRD